MNGEPTKEHLARLWREVAESRRREAEAVEGLPELRAHLSRVLADIDRADRAAEQALVDGLSERDLRERASLLIRCRDCGGRVVAHVTWIEGRPLLWAAQDRGPGSRVWLDSGLWGDAAWCRVREYVLHHDVLRAQTPSPGKPQRTVRVSHHGRRGAMR